MRWFSRRSAVSGEPDHPVDLESLMPEISRGNREAFAELYDATADAVRTELAGHLRDPHEVNRVCGSVYVEVWWLAGCYLSHPGGVRAWVAEIVGRRVAERASPQAFVRADGRSRLPSNPERELAGLLGRPPDHIGGGTG